MENGTNTVTSLKKCINYSKPVFLMKIMWEGFISVIYDIWFQRVKEMIQVYVCWQVCVIVKICGGKILLL